ncbi:hypothetical protein [Breoghania sp.]|uniref:hypothetical protein n=1 Tax=Breoghania sp. TaxID=2065378 RepID=UPI00262AF1AB|nr:hypothetical protein [Breoghania sp.]MDJ0933686.1 hypothetical protein [Breoghania sp.]
MGKTVHIHNETVDVTTALPSDWDFSSADSAEIYVLLQVRRSVKDMEIGITSQNENFTLTVPPVNEQVDSSLLLGTFKIEKFTDENGFADKTHTGWTRESTYASRNFVHIMKGVATPLNESLLLQNYSSMLAEIAEIMPRPGGIDSLFQLENQTGTEDHGTFVADFEATLAQVYAGDTETALNPQYTPTAAFDFDAAYGEYGWEIFYHIPSAVVAGYADVGQFNEALAWLEKIFNPRSNPIWNVYPLRGASVPEAGPAFDDGGVTADPDRLATDYPFYYQHAAIRHYLEVMIASGYADYEEETQESLQRAKATYVAAKQLFRDTLGETLEVLTNQPWPNPSLGEAADYEFGGFLPHNQEIRDLYDTIETRLSDLRHWLDVKRKPLNVPLLAVPIDPKEFAGRCQGGLEPAGRRL